MKRILIVDDDPVIASVYRGKFTRQGYSAEIAVDGRDGLDKISGWKPDLVLLDLMMPTIDGMSLLKEIRASDATRELPVVVYSNSFSRETHDQAKQLGASHLLSKGETRPNQLLEVVASILGQGIAEQARPDMQTEENDREKCLANAKKIAAEMRPMLKEYFARNDQALLFTLHMKAYVFRANAWIAGLQRAAHLCEALESLLQTLCEHPKYISFSTDKTVLQAIECLESLAAGGGDPAAPVKPSILVIDDQETSLQAASIALKKAKLAAVGVLDAIEGLEMIEKQKFDLVLLDIDMPKMDGMTLCVHLRTNSMNQATPVIFFSQLTEIGSRMNSIAAGGSDFIGKPFLTIELAVKALVWVLNPPKGPPSMPPSTRLPVQPPV